MISFFFFFNDILVCLHSFFNVCMYGCVGSSFLCKGLLQLWQAGATLHRGAWASHYRGLSLLSTGSRRAGSVIVAHGPSCSAARGIFPDQGSNPRPLHWQADSQPLRHQGSPDFIFLIKGMRWLSNGFNARQKLTHPTNKILTKRISNIKQTVGKVEATEEEMCEEIQTKSESKAENWDPMGHSLRRIFSQLRDAERSVLVHDHTRELWTAGF